ncbi:hypothetical protein GCM10010404_50200 [Nonomuraea africana]
MASAVTGPLAAASTPGLHVPLTCLVPHSAPLMWDDAPGGRPDPPGRRPEERSHARKPDGRAVGTRRDGLSSSAFFVLALLGHVKDDPAVPAVVQRRCAARVLPLRV